MSKKILLHLSILFCFQMFSQEQAWVFFTDKPDSETRLLSPETFLTEKALLRKQKHQTVIDSRDLPIETTYINTLKEQTGITYLATSKWFNAAYIEGAQSDIEDLQELEFVSSIFYMDRSLNTSAAAKKLYENKIVELNKVESTTNFNYGSTETQVNQINLDDLHDVPYTGNGMTIAVMDNGFANVNIIEAFDRARENNLLLGGYDFVNKTDAIYEYTDGSHGTNVLSTMLGYIEDNFVGTAIDAQYYLFRTEVNESESPQEEAFWIAAAERADSLGVDIINTSLGYSNFDDSKYDYTNSDMDGETAFISQGVTIALEKGMLPVCSAGNSGNSTWRIITAPADSPSALSIGAIDENGDLASFSSVGPNANGHIKPDVVALGLDAAVISSSGEINTLIDGTSFSSPIMAGAIACLWESLPDNSAQEIMDLVRNSASISNNPNNEIGYGIPDFGSILDTLNITDFNLSEINNQIELIENPVENELIFNFPEEWNTQKFNIYSISGERILSGTLNTNEKIIASNLSAGIYFFTTNDLKNVIRFVKY